MSTLGLMSLGSRAMGAAQAQLQTTGNNITNASVEGYSRQSVVLTTAHSQYTGAGYIGRGVDVSTVSRAVNSFLTDEVAQTASAAAMDRTQADLLDQLQSAFGTGENGLGYATTQLFSAWSDLASNPSDASARRVVLARADDVASLTRNTSSQIESMQASVVDGVKAGVARVNELAGQVANLNQQIMSARGSSQAPNDLLDQRDQLINQISQYVQVTRVEQVPGDGQGRSSAGQSTNAVNLFIGGGQALVLGTSAATLVATRDEVDDAKVGVAIEVGATTQALDETALGGGSLAGQLAFQNDDLRDARFQLDRLVASMTSEVNAQQQLGLDSTGAAGKALFTSAWTKDGVDSYRLAGHAAQGNQSAAAPTISTTDLSLLADSDYELRADANGSTYTLTRLADGVQTTGVLDGQAVDGFELHIGAVAAAAGDSFRFRPFADAAQGLQLAIREPGQVAAAAPLTARAAAGNTGSGTVTGAAITATTVISSAWSVKFTDNDGHYEINGQAASDTWTSSRPISYQGMALSLTGTPRMGDTFDVTPTRNFASSNGNALAMVSLGTRPVLDGANLADAYASVLSDVGVRVQSARSSADVSEAVAGQTRQNLSSQTGVNLDEEAARLIQYQQSYQAAAKILQVAQKIFDTVLGIANG
ncbi:MAG: hypothetical protein RLZZ584_350 [Pseudomonadota bacterium]|jgi:flagellar hook-associated protein 1 FlgK